jgi:CHAT domain-containing protein/predicted negative regulator of RcsB-dependent stress response
VAKPRAQAIALGVFVLALTSADLPARANEDGSAQQFMVRGRAAFERGALDDAAKNWQQALQLYEAQKNSKGQVEALVKLGLACQSLGQYRLSVQTMERAVAVAERSRDRASLILAKAHLGMAGTCGQELGAAERQLRESLAMAEADKDWSMAAVIWNNLGNLLATQKKVDEALEAFERAVAFADSPVGRALRSAPNGGFGETALPKYSLAAKARANAAATAATARKIAEAGQLNESALELTRQLRATHEQAMLLVRCGQTDWQLRQQSSDEKEFFSKRAEQSYEQALDVAGAIGDRRAQTYALGFLGQLYEADGQTGKSLAVTRRAAFLAQQVPSPDTLYRWEWQTGRLLRAQGDREAAIAAYRRAVQTLGPIRADLAVGLGRQPGAAGFREAVGGVYFELADLLLQRADAQTDPGEIQQTLREARDTVEQLKSAELEDYLRDECVALQLAKVAPVERIGKNTAVIYIVPLADRTELLIGFASGMKRFKLPVTATQLTSEVRKFRHNLEKRTTNEYLLEARALYDWLIRPIRDELAGHAVDTLVFVPDGALRTVPLTALQDGEQFLVEQFAVAVTPGLTLLEPRPIARDRVRVLVGGLTEPVGNYPPLPYVAGELRGIETAFRGERLLDRDFVLPKLQRDFTQTQYQMVHFATHGQFAGDASQSFLVTYDGKLTLDQLEQLIRPSQFRGKPVELLALSACQTAAGDDRAALGLAGVAVKAGARSALATLWSVHDQSTAMLMEEFYRRLRAEPTASKADALRQAQRKLMADARYEHPYYWSPFLIIGNWL